MGAVVSDPAAHFVCRAPGVAQAGAAHHPPRHRGLSAQAGGTQTVRGRQRRGHPQGENGSATGPTIPRGLRLGMVLRVRRNRPRRADAATGKPAREGDFHKTSRELIPSRSLGLVIQSVHAEKEGLNFLYARWQQFTMQTSPGVGLIQKVAAMTALAWRKAGSGAPGTGEAFAIHALAVLESAGKRWLPRKYWRAYARDPRPASLDFSNCCYYNKGDGHAPSLGRSQAASQS